METLFFLYKLCFISSLNEASELTKLSFGPLFFTKVQGLNYLSGSVQFSCSLSTSSVVCVEQSGSRGRGCRQSKAAFS